MAKILGQSGKSLADLYDVEGSIAGIEELDAESVKLVHDMGPTIHSEQLTTQIFRAVMADTAQNLEVDTIFAGLPGPLSRIYGVACIIDTTARMANYVVSVESAADGQDFPIWAWDGTNEDTFRFNDAGAGAAQTIFLRAAPEYTNMPNMRLGVNAGNGADSVERVVCRGLTAGFGAGDVSVTTLLYMAMPTGDVGISNVGLPPPSW